MRGSSSRASTGSDAMSSGTVGSAWGPAGSGCRQLRQLRHAAPPVGAEDAIGLAGAGLDLPGLEQHRGVVAVAADAVRAQGLLDPVSRSTKAGS
jgi:hypothetical protein